MKSRLLVFVILLLPSVAIAGEYGPLHKATHDRDLQAMVELLEGGVDPNTLGPDGRTPLHYAVERGTLDAIQLLLDAGADPKKRDAELTTPIRAAAIKGRRNVYEVLLKACGGNEPVVPVGKEYQSDKTTEELISSHISDCAKLTIIARGKRTVPAILSQIRASNPGPRRRDLFEILRRLGPEGEEAIPTLTDWLDDKSLLAKARSTLERLRPGHYDSLPTPVRERAEDTHVEAALTPAPHSTPHGNAYPYYDAVQCVLLLPDEKYLLLLDHEQDIRWGFAANLSTRRHYFQGFRNEDGTYLSQAAPLFRQLQQKLFKLLREASDDEQKKYIARVLGRIPYQQLPLNGQRARDSMFELLKSPPVHDDAEQMLNKRRQSPRDAATSAGRALVNLGVHVDQLVPFLSPNSNPSRYGAIAGLASIDTTQVPELLKLLSHEDPSVAEAARFACARHGEHLGNVAGWNLYTIAERDYEKSQADMANAIQQPADVNVLIEAVKQTAHAIRFRVVAARIAISKPLTATQREKLGELVPSLAKNEHRSRLHDLDEAALHWAVAVFRKFPEESSACLPAIRSTLKSIRENGYLHNRLSQESATYFHDEFTRSTNSLQELINELEREEAGSDITTHAK